MKVYCFSGLGADERVFQFLDLGPEYDIVPVAWINPLKNESIESYSERILSSIDIDKNCMVLGVSFGGVVAQEGSKRVKSTKTIIISSIKDRSGIPILLKIIPNFILRIIPKSFFNLPKSIAAILFGASNKELLFQILKDTEPSFVKWALIGLKNWKANIYESDIYISGAKDYLLKPFKSALIIDGGGHFMIVDKANEISRLVKKYLHQ